MIFVSCSTKQKIVVDDNHIAFRLNHRMSSKGVKHS